MRLNVLYNSVCYNALVKFINLLVKVAQGHNLKPSSDPFAAAFAGWTLGSTNYSAVPATFMFYKAVGHKQILLKFPPF